jgi:hypothetical protein
MHFLGTVWGRRKQNTIGGSHHNWLHCTRKAAFLGPTKVPPVHSMPASAFPTTPSPTTHCNFSKPYERAHAEAKWRESAPTHTRTHTSTHTQGDAATYTMTSKLVSAGAATAEIARRATRAAPWTTFMTLSLWKRNTKQCVKGRHCTVASRVNAPTNDHPKMQRF